MDNSTCYMQEHCVYCLPYFDKCVKECVEKVLYFSDQKVLSEDKVHLRTKCTYNGFQTAQLCVCALLVYLRNVQFYPDSQGDLEVKFSILNQTTNFLYYIPHKYMMILTLRQTQGTLWMSEWVMLLIYENVYLIK